MSLLQVPTKTHIQHRGTTLPACALSNFFDFNSACSCYLIGNQVNSAAACIADNELAAYL